MVTKVTNKLSKNIKLIIFVAILLLYAVAQVFWINIKQTMPCDDQGYVYQIAKIMYENNKLIMKNYVESYPQQLTLATAYILCFKIYNSTNPLIIQYYNIISNVLTVVSLYLITKQLSKKYTINLAKTILFSVGFISLAMLSTFVYGDLMSFSMDFFSVYFVMLYEEKKKVNYLIISSIFMAIALILRMNSLIFVIAIVIYLILNIMKEKNTLKQNLKYIIAITLFCVISIVPANLIKMYWQNKYDLDTTKKYPIQSFLYIGSNTRSQRAYGWYDNALYLIEDYDTRKQYWEEGLNENIEHFKSDPLFCLKFYKEKTISMWTENTYSAVWYNKSFNCSRIMLGYQTDLDKTIDQILQDSETNLQIYQKAVVLMIFGTSILFLIKNKDNMSEEAILLITIFIGGFLFHTIWEAKSRYVIPYILALIPIASAEININWKNIKEKKKLKK